MKFISAIVASIAVGCLSTAALSQSTAVQWTTESGGNGHWYEIQQLPTRPTCFEAESMASQSGARLVALETLAENNFFRSFRCSQGNQHLSGWQDLRRIANQWTWASGEPFVFQSWSDGQPDGGDTATIDWAGPNGQCETLTWGDENCTIANLPVALFLEWSADCNSDGIVDYGQILSGALADANSNGVPDCCESGPPCPQNDLLVPQQYSTIQAAIDAASAGSRVLVAPGTYFGQVNLSGKDIQIIGLFGAGSTFLDGNHSQTVIVGSNEPSTCTVRGFTIQNGSDSGYYNGGGVRLYESSAVFTDCQFKNNVAVAPAWWAAGAFRSEGGHPTIDHCVFANNFGAGNTSCIYHYLSGGITVRDCQFVDNSSASGQALHIQTEGGSISSVIENCDFNRCTGGEGSAIGFWNPYSGSMTCSISNCRFENPVITSQPPPATLDAVTLSGYQNSTWNIVLTGNWACGVDNLARAFGNATWINGGGNTVVPQCAIDNCPNDPNKTEPGQCGCGVADTDTDSDGTANCIDDDDDNDGVVDSADAFPLDASESVDTDGDGVGNNADQDDDGDGADDATDGCPLDANKSAPGQCGCGIADTDSDGDGVADCIDDDDDNDGVVDSADAFPLDASESVDTDGDGIGNNADQDDDGDGADDATDGCPLDPAKSSPGQCGCGIADTDSDSDGVANCVDNCVAIANPTQADCNGNGIGDACEPAPMTTITAKLWGAAGGPNRCCDGWITGGTINCGHTGIAGGYVNASFDSITPGSTLFIYVGQGGSFNGLTNTFGGGGHAGSTGGGSGGGASYISLVPDPTVDQSTMLLAVAGGGAGGANQSSANDVLGNGGGSNGAIGHISPAGGVAAMGGTQSSGGTSATGGYGGGGNAGSDGQFLQGGFGMGCAGGGGGGGLYGGGGGHGDCGGCSDGIGGGGSSFINVAFGALIHHNDQGTRQIVHPNASADPDWANDAGNGTNGTGNGGRVVLVINDVRYIFNYTGSVQTFVVPGVIADCNANGVPDSCDIASGAAGDCNTNAIPDSCEVDSDADGTIDACDGCPNDPAKIAAGTCGCGVADTDTDSDGTANCIDDDDDNDGVADSADAFPLDASESVDTDGDGIGNNADQDDDGDGADDATDGCPLDPAKSSPGQCGCGIADTDSDSDGVADCIDNCVSIPNPNQADCDSSGVGDACEFQTAIVSDDFNDGQVNPNLWQTYLPNSCSAITEANGVLRSVGRGQLRSALTYPLKNTQLTLSYMWRPVAGDELFSTVFRSDLTQAAYGGVTNGLLFDYYGGNLQLGVSANFSIESQAESGPENVTFGQWYQVTAVLQENFFGVVVTSIVDPNWQWTSQVNYFGDALGDRFVIHSREFCNTISEIDNLIIQTRSAESDCNANGIPDSCDIASGAAGDCNTNAIPDSCEVDSDADGTIDACDGCPNDPAKNAAGVCGCGVADTDTDSDGTANCIDDDDDGDGVADSADAFPLDASESVDTDGDGIGNNADQDDDGDGADDATDGCPLDANKSAPGQCGCGIADTDTDGDGVADCIDNCAAVANPTQDDCNGNGIGEACESFTDCNANSIPDSCDIASGFAQDCNGNGKPDSCDLAFSGSPYAGAVQWTVASGGNGHWYWVSTNATMWEPASEFAQSIGGQLATIGNVEENSFVRSIISSNTWLGGFQSPGSCEPDCEWQWVTGEPWSYTNWTGGEPNNGDSEQDAVSMYWYSGEWDDGTNIAYQFAMIVEWPATESDCNSNGVPDSCEIASGAASDCNTNAIPDSCEVDSDADGTIDACDGCPNDPAKIAAGVCGCGVADTDTDSDGIANCIDDDDDNDGAVDSADAFPLDASESVDTDGDGVGNNADQDDDGDGADDATDGCPLDANKSAPGQCGCGIADTDTDGDGVADCIDNCAAVANPTQDDCNGNGIGEACESFTDCNANSIPDSCDIASGFAQDCNANGKPDSCDISAGNGSPYPGAVQWTIASGGNGHWYQRFDTPVLWAEARDISASVGGYLATVPTAEENAFVALINAGHDCWLGGFQAPDSCETNCDWQWVTGESWSWTNWDGGQPDNAGDEDQLQYWSGSNRWNDHRADIRFGYIIEWSTGLPTESDCNSNGIPDSCDISSGFDADCDSNGIPNSCEIAAGALDCNGNGIPDACDVLSGGASVDCNANGIPDSCDIASGASMDCNSNAIPDSCDIATGASRDVDSNGVPDECKPDCNNNDLPDAWEIAQGLVPDCNNNGIPDSCENDSRAANTGNMGRFGNGVPATGTLSAVVATTTAVTVRIEAVGDLGAATEYATLKLGQTVVGTLLFQTTGHDCPANPDVATLTLTKAQWNAIVASAGSSGNVAVTLTGSPLVDAAQCGEAGMSYVSVTYGGPAYDCDGNGLSDLCEVGSGTGDCNNNSILDACELLSGSAPDIDANGVIDSCQTDCNGNSLPDTYEVAQGLVPDCNGNGIPDSCDLAGGAPDCNMNGIIDSCDIASGSAPDCNSNGKPDSCDISSGFAPDCNANSIPDSCDISSGTIPDCNNNGVPDSCDVASGAPDCNNNGVPDSCDVASGSSNDVDTNGVPDECKTDCNANGLPDAWEILQHLVPDCNGNSVPDSCDVADGTAKDCNDNGIPDSCDIAAGEVDKNSDGQPDSCQYLYGDFDLDGNIGGSDLAVLLALWGTIDPVVGDITSDGRVDGQDLAQILARWGPVP